jgi:voltage-gated potassium channel
MAFTYEFLRIFGLELVYAWPLLLALVTFIAIVGQMIGRWEGWSRSDALYYAFITASTVGYGDFHPTRRSSKFWAISIALLGLMLTGLVVALGVQAATSAFKLVNPNAVDGFNSL